MLAPSKQIIWYKMDTQSESDDTFLIVLLSQSLPKMLGWLGVITVVVIGLLSTIQIVSRFVPSNIMPISVGWTTSVVRYLLVFMVALGVPYAMQKDSHVSVRPLLQRLPQRLFYILILFSNILICIMCVLVIVSGIHLSDRTLNVSLQTVNWLKTGYAHLFISSMFAITFIYTVIQMYQIMTDPEKMSVVGSDSHVSGISEGEDNA